MVEISRFADGSELSSIAVDERQLIAVDDAASAIDQGAVCRHREQTVPDPGIELDLGSHQPRLAGQLEPLEVEGLGAEVAVLPPARSPEGAYSALELQSSTTLWGAPSSEPTRSSSLSDVEV